MSNLREAAFNAACLRAQIAPTTAQQARFFENNAATVMGIRFPNRLGIAAGFDKHGQLGRAAGALGFGCIELGTLTLGQDLTGITQTATACIPAILGVNLKLDDESQQYTEKELLLRIAQTNNTADYISVNLYENRNEDSLPVILERLTTIRQYQNELLKIHHKVLPIILKLHTQPLTNTLICLLKRLESAPIDGIAIAFDLGKPVTKNSYLFWQDSAVQAHVCHQLEHCRKIIKHDTALIAIGGVSQSQHYQDRLNAGADLVQLHNALVFNGYDIAKKILRH
ncbi:MAG: hypothetical protein RBR22_10210 [Desulfuromonas sp.]|nr:hypothetical protein [Desulfuromonas sp.]